MRIGIFTPPDTAGATPLDAVLGQVKRADLDGFDSFWFVQLPTTGHDALTTMALAGQQTRQIELGTAVIPTYPRHPLTLAQQALTVQVATGGRLTLGVGLSHRPVVEQIMGLSYEGPARHMREYLSVLRPLISQGVVDFEGQVFRVNASLHVTGATPFPLLIAALAPRMLQIAGEMADGTITWMAGTKTIGSHIVPRMNAAAATADRPQPRVCVGLPIAVTDDGDGAREQIARAFQRYGQLANYRRMLDIEGVAGPGDVAVVGNEDEVVGQLEALAAAGATDFLASIFPFGHDRAASFERTWAMLKALSQKQ